MPSVPIAIAADHRGFALKDQLVPWLAEQGYEIRDFGARELVPTDDYPDFGIPAAQFVAEDPTRRRGILICGTGQGMVIVANKVRGVRAILIDRPGGYYAGETPQILAFAADCLPLTDAQTVIAQWLASFDQPLAARHQRRIEKIDQLEARSEK